MQTISSSLEERMQTLTAEQLDQVAMFVEALQSEDVLPAGLSEPAFAAVWTNPDDAAYDRL